MDFADNHLPDAGALGFLVSCEVVMGREGGVVIYLLDEFHHSLECVDQNLAVARHLVRHARVDLLGCEDFPSRIDGYDREDQHLVTLEASDVVPGTGAIGEGTRFGWTLAAEGLPVIGVDSGAWKIRTQILAQDYSDINTNPANLKRAPHFVDALLREAKERSITGNVLLNCGGAHNGRITAEAAKRSTPEDRWEGATFCRVRVAAYPQPPLLGRSC